MVSRLSGIACVRFLRMRQRTRVPEGALLVLAVCLFAAHPSVGYAAEVTYYYTDPQGTVLATTDAAGTLTGAYDYRPFGSPVLGSASAGPGYTGHVTDSDSGLIYMQARYYDSQAGRFLSIDPVWAGGFNRYWYASDNPMRYVDPDGRLSRGAGWSGKDWSDFNRSQQRSAGRLERAANSINKALAAGGDDLKSAQASFEKVFGEGSGTSENMAKVAGDLTVMASALRNTGSDAIVANAMTSTEIHASYKDVDPETLAGVPASGPKMVIVNKSHHDFSNPTALSWASGHETVHAVLGYRDQQINGISAYKFGRPEQISTFNSLSTEQRLVNPDTLMDAAQ